MRGCGNVSGMSCAHKVSDFAFQIRAFQFALVISSGCKDKPDSGSGGALGWQGRARGLLFPMVVGSTGLPGG